MALAVRAASQNSSSSGTAVTVSAPAGTTAGDLVVCIVHGNGQETLSDNNGSTPFTEAPNFSDYKPNTSSGHVMSVFYRTIQAGDPSTYAFTLSASGRWAIVAIAYSGTSPTFDVAPNTSNASNTDNADSGTQNAPSISVEANTIHTVFCGWDTSAVGSITTPTGYTLAANANGGGEPTHASYKAFATGGSTGAVECANTEFGAMIAASFSVKEGSSGSAYDKTVSESITNTETISKSTIRTMSESSTITSTTIKNSIRAIVELFSNTDSLSNAPIKVHSDAGSFSDAVLRAPSKNISENQSFVESLTRSITRTIAESISYIEALVKAIIRTIAESQTISDAVALSKVTLKTISETISFVDSVLKSTVKTMVESQTVAASVEAIKVALKEISDTVTFIDTKTRSIVRTVGEFVQSTIIFLEQTTKTIVRTVSDTTSISEAYSRILLKIITLLETITFVEVVTRFFIRTVNDSASFVATILGSIPTFPIYRKLKGGISSVKRICGIKKTTIK